MIRLPRLLALAAIAVAPLALAAQASAKARHPATDRELARHWGKSAPAGSN